MNLRFYTLAVALLFSLTSYAQTLRGTVRDADNGGGIVGATIAVRFSRGDTPPVSLATNPSGSFVFEKLRVGYYSVEITAAGFESQVIAEVAVVSGKEQVLEIALRRSASQLAEVTILATQPGRRAPQPLGEIPLTRDQTLRFPAMFFDPARLAAAYPGVMQNDDGTNVLSIRGNSPSSVRWRLEGVDIVNPNHLPNAGTFSDRPAAASGGILMFSAQLLDNSSLLIGPMPAGYGDALGGIMDMNLRRGNNRQHEFTAQAGLVGLDLAAEGPMGNRLEASAGEKGPGKGSYLVNYRYSTVGLLGELGVSFGDEQINFQDLSFHFNMDGKKGGRWSVFGLGGLSKNTFRHKTDPVEIKAYKDFFDIDFESKTGVLGLSNWSPTGKNGWIKTSVAYSSQTNDRVATTEAYTDRFTNDDIQEEKTSGSVTVSQRLGQQSMLLFGFNVALNNYSSSSIFNNLSFKAYSQKYLMTQPWVQLSWQSQNQRLSTALGLHSAYFDNQTSKEAKDVFSLQPRFLFTCKLAEKHRLSVAAGTYSQTPALWLLHTNSTLINTVKVELGYAWNFAPAWQFKPSLYVQRITNVPYFSGMRFNLLNNAEFIPTNGLSDYVLTKGFNRGVEASLERTLSDGWFLLAALSVFDSRYTNVGNSDTTKYLPTRWDMGHISSLTFGKEWQREKGSGKERIFGLNARAVWTGGAREARINHTSSMDTGTTIVDDRSGYDRQFPSYFRLDLRMYWRKNLGNRRNSTFALDIQNLTGQQNFSYNYYDRYTNNIETKYQLGTIPNFSWRLEF